MKTLAKKLFAVITIIACLFSCIPVFAEIDFPTNPAEFYGSLKYDNGALVPKGAHIEAIYIDGEENEVNVGSLTTKVDGLYGGSNLTDTKLVINRSGVLLDRRFTFVKIMVNGQLATTIDFYEHANQEKAEKLDLTVPYVQQVTTTVISNPVPADGSTTTDTTPDISADLSATNSTINTSKVTLAIDGTAVTATVTASKVSYTPAAALSTGSYNVKVTAENMEGVKAEKTWSFTINQEPASPPPPPPPSGGGGGSVPVPSYNENIEKLDGSLIFTRTLTVADKKAKGSLSSSDITTALNAVTADNKGIKSFVIEMPSLTDVTTFTQEFPASALVDAEKTKYILRMDGVTMEIPGNMFTKAQAGTAKTIAITVEIGNVKSLDSTAQIEIGNRPFVNISAAADGKAVVWSRPEQAIVISLNYTATTYEQTLFIVARSIDANGKTVPVPNGKYVEANKCVTFRTPDLGKYAVAFVKKTFDDVANAQWAKDAIEAMASRGVTYGTSPTTYGVSHNIKRGDFIVLLTRVLGTSANIVDNYADLVGQESSYIYNPIGMCKTLGITGEMPDNKFRPSEMITREEFMVFMARALIDQGKLSLDGTLDDLKAFTDASEINADNVVYVASLVKAGLIFGSNNKLSPDANASRAEIAAILFRLYNR